MLSASANLSSFCAFNVIAFVEVSPAEVKLVNSPDPKATFPAEPLNTSEEFVASAIKVNLEVESSNPKIQLLQKIHYGI